MKKTSFAVALVTLLLVLSGCNVQKENAEEPQAMEPVVEEPQVMEPVVEEPQVMEPVVEEPQVMEPVVEEPQAMEGAAEEAAEGETPPASE